MTLLERMEAEQAQGWPTPHRWQQGDVYPDPLLAAYVLAIRRAVRQSMRHPR